VAVIEIGQCVHSEHYCSTSVASETTAGSYGNHLKKKTVIKCEIDVQ